MAARAETLRSAGWLCGALLLAAIILAFDPGMDWRLDVHHRAELGYPRLMGVWTVRSVLFAGLVLPPLMLTALLLRESNHPQRRQRRPRRLMLMGLLMLHLLLAVVLGGVEAGGRLFPQALPQAWLGYFPYRAYYLFWEGNSYFVDDEELGLRYRPGAVIRREVDYGATGDLHTLGAVQPWDESLPGYRVVYERRFNRYGVAGEFATFGERADEPPAEVVFLGDSFTVAYGLPAEESWPAVLLSRLADAGHLDAESLKAAPLMAGAQFATGGWTPTQAWRAFERFAPAARPRLIVVMFYEGNDLADAAAIGCRARPGTMEGTRPFRLALEHRPAGWVETSPVHAALAHAFRYTDLRLPFADRGEPWRRFEADPRAQVFRGVPALEAAGIRIPHIVGNTTQPFQPLSVELGGQVVPYVIDPWELTQLTRPGTSWPREHRGWPCILEGLDAMAAFQAHHGIPILLVSAPSRLRVHYPLLPDEALRHPSLWEIGPPPREIDAWSHEAREDAAGWRALLRSRADTLSRCLSEEAQVRGLRFFDLAPALTNAAADANQSELLYLPYDTHWGVRGNRVVADEILGEILRLGLLD